MTATNLLTSCLILSVRRQYYSCHIQLPDSDKRVAAIVIHSEYYSLFKVFKSPDRAIDMVVRLGQRGQEVVMRQLPVGMYALWVKEEDARPTRSHRLVERRSTCQPKPAPCYILMSEDAYQLVDITVPDLDKSLSAIRFQDRYYSLFKSEPTMEQTIELAAKLTYRGDETIILVLQDQSLKYVVCVIEPDAVPI